MKKISLSANVDFFYNQNKIKKDFYINPSESKNNEKEVLKQYLIEINNYFSGIKNLKLNLLCWDETIVTGANVPVTGALVPVSGAFVPAPCANAPVTDATLPVYWAIFRETDYTLPKMFCINNKILFQQNIKLMYIETNNNKHIY